MITIVRTCGRMSGERTVKKAFKIVPEAKRPVGNPRNE
jgi:hypothetical protein